MVQRLDAIKEGGGSIKVGTTGTIGSLMTRELQPRKSTVLVSSKTEGFGACKLPKGRKSVDQESSSRNVEHVGKAKGLSQKTHKIPILESDNNGVDGTPMPEKPNKKVGIVEIVDLKCGRGDRRWGSSLTKLKKFGFSKLSESAV